MKYYLFYLKPHKTLYAFTTQKDYADLFLEQRNPKCFKVKETKLKGEKEKIFLYTHKDIMLSLFPYQTTGSNGEYVNLLATPKEESDISNKLEEMQNEVIEINKILKEIKLKEKYEKIIKRMIKLDSGGGELVIDVFSLFVDRNRNTFIYPEEYKKHDKSVWQSQSDNEHEDVFSYF